jgi:hypothetical protein
MFFMRSSGSDASIRLAHVRSWVKGFAQVSGLAIKGSIIVSQSSQIPGALRVPLRA